MADAAPMRGFASAVPAPAAAPRHSALVRATHWIATACFFALLVTGLEIVISHPRFYWGETGNVKTPALFQLPIPASRAAVNTGYGFVLADQNGWSRSLHFQAAWVVVFTGLLYLAAGFATRHFRRNLLPSLSLAEFRKALAAHLRFERPGEAGAWSYNPLQRSAYLAVIFGLFPLMIWTGLAMSPAVNSAFPFLVKVCGGQQSARTIHFFGTLALALFLAVHVGMVIRAGFRNRMRAMITGRTAAGKELP